MPCFFAEQQLSPSQACCVCLQALTPSADGAELIAGTRSMLSWRSVQAVNPRCRNGKMWRLLSSDLTATLQSASHTGEAAACCTDLPFYRCFATSDSSTEQAGMTRTLF